MPQSRPPVHDSTQQPLVALRINLALASAQMAHPGQRKMVEEFGDQVEATIDELRNVTRGVYPNVLRHAGTGAALNAIARHAAMPISIKQRPAAALPGRHRTRSLLCVP